MSGDGVTLDVWRIQRGQEPVRQPDLLADERPCRVIAGGHEAAMLMATPRNLRAWAAGFCITMGWAYPADPPPIVSREGDTVHVDLALESPPDAGARATGGGPMGPGDVEALPPSPAMDIELIMDLTGRMSQQQELFKATGATHAAALFGLDGEMLAMGEDVGRHNAVDKAVGGAWLAGKLPQAQAAALSGRISLEMALKVARAGVPIVISVSAPTGPAVQKAAEIGLSVLGFSRGGRINLYSNAQRVSRNGRPLG